MPDTPQVAPVQTVPASSPTSTPAPATPRPQPQPQQQQKPAPQPAPPKTTPKPVEQESPPSAPPTQKNAVGDDEAKDIKGLKLALPWGLAGLFGTGLVIVVFLLQQSPQGFPVIPTASAGGTAPATAPVAPSSQFVPPPPRQGPTFNEVDARMDDRGFTWTEAQKQSYWQSVTGTQVTWAGEVTEVRITSGGEIMMKCNPQTFTSDVTVTLDGSQTNLLPSINKGQRVTIQGILQQHTGYGYTIAQGRVIGF